MGDLMDKSCAGVILCGGESRRMGYPKALLPFGRITMLEHMVELIQPMVGRVVVVASPDQKLPLLSSEVEICHDKVAYQGPLSGMQCGLGAVHNLFEYGFVTAVDTPLLHPGLIRLEMELMRGHDVVMPWDGTYYYPLTACYRVGPVLDKINELRIQNRHRPLFLFQEMKSRAILLEEIRQVDSELKSLKNINTLEEYRDLVRSAGYAIPPEFQKPRVRVEFYGVPRLKTGLDLVLIHAGTVLELLDELSGRFPALVNTVIFDGRLHPAYQFVRGDSEFITDQETCLKADDTILLMNVDVGG